MLLRGCVRTAVCARSMSILVPHTVVPSDVTGHAVRFDDSPGGRCAELRHERRRVNLVPAADAALLVDQPADRTSHLLVRTLPKRPSHCQPMLALSQQCATWAASLCFLATVGPLPLISPRCPCACAEGFVARSHMIQPGWTTPEIGSPSHAPCPTCTWTYCGDRRCDRCLVTIPIESRFLQVAYGLLVRWTHRCADPACGSPAAPGSASRAARTATHG